jgi:putative hydrolase of the HAD superfamily
MTRALGFDLDNTLYDQDQHVLPFFSDAAVRLGEQTGIKPCRFEETFHKAWQEFGPSYSKLFDVVLDRHEVYTPERVRMLVQLYHQCIGPLAVYPGVQSLLSRLSEIFPLFLITDGNPGMQRRKIDRLGIASHFQVIVLSAEHGAGKPDPAPFLAALRQLGCPPGTCMFVGDNPLCDVLGAARAGMKTTRVLTGPFRGSQSDTPADFTIDSVLDIETVIDGN